MQGQALVPREVSKQISDIHRGGVRTDDDGDVVMSSYDTPSNHLSSANSFKGKDTDVERFVNICERQFKFYVNFYSSGKKKVEFIESHLGPAFDWYYMFLGESQKIKPGASLVLTGLSDYYLNQTPASMKWTNLISLEHKWGKSVDFVTKFRLY